MKNIASFSAIIILATACNTNNKGFDATGTFESTEVTVSSEVTGKILNLEFEEGDTVNAFSKLGTFYIRSTTRRGHHFFGQIGI